MSDANTARDAMRAHLERQAEHYRKVLDLSRRQVAAVREGDTDALMTILSEKQTLMKAIEAEAAAGAPALEAWDAAKGNLAAEERQPVETVHQEIKTILAEVLQMEEEGRAALGNRSDAQGQQLRNMQRGKQMLRAYGTAPPVDRGGRFTDNRK